MRRQTGVCSGSACFVDLLADGTDHTCVNDDQPTGCTQHWDITANNVLTADSGILYLTIELAFGGTTGWVEIGGARLTLKHE